MTRARVLLDFDGTVTLIDAVDCILERFAAPRWRIIEEAWQRGSIGSRECLRQQTALLRTTPDDLDALIDTVPVDPGFTRLVRRCRDLAVDLMIVSDGYDRVIQRVLQRMDLEVPYVCNSLRPFARDRWQLIAPASRAGCRVAASHCKCAHVDPADTTVVIGDGRSDFCVAHAADLVIGKGALATYCEHNSLPVVGVTDLVEAADVLERWFRLRERRLPLPVVQGDLA